MRTIDFPGGSAELRDGPDIRQRDRRLVLSAGLAAAGALAKIEAQNIEPSAIAEKDVASLGLTFAEAEAFQDMQDAMIVASLCSWTLAQPLPTMQTVGDLKPDVYDALEKATQSSINAVLTGTDFEPSDPTEPGFPATPTLPSDDSVIVLRANEESDSTDTSATSGPSTDFAQPSPGSLTATI